MLQSSTFRFTIHDILLFKVIPRDKQAVWLAANLAILDILLGITPRRIDEDGIALKTVGAEKITIHGNSILADTPH